MRRKLFNLLAAVSLLLCAGVAGVGVRSYWVADEFVYAALGKPGPAGRRAIEVSLTASLGGSEIAWSRLTATTPLQVEELAYAVEPLGLSHNPDNLTGEPEYPSSANNALGRFA
ncbi:MAG TPA: hypothetical protein VIL86_07425 [Tepidisphaeraceae bacterium]|jgi:hypothetical protein